MHTSPFARVISFLLLATLLVPLPVRAAGNAGAKTELFPSLADLAEKIRPAVVNVSTVSTVKVPDDHFRFFFGPGQNPFGENRRFFEDKPDREMKQSGLGSGFIFDREGYIITNSHVVEKADEIKVRLSDGREFTAKVVGRDAKTDLALIKISSEAKDLPFLVLGDSTRARVGDWVLAVGNPFGLEHSVTHGIISATGRVIGAGPYDDFLQTDAAINPGNSGGPLVNLQGEVIGITSIMISGGQGVGFAIPSSSAKVVIAQLREKGKVVRGWLGVTIQQVTPEIAESFTLKEPKGALVADVAPGGPAEAAGILRGDVILSFDGKEIKSSSDLPRVVAATPVGKEAKVRIVREGKEITKSAKIKELAEEEAGEATPSTKSEGVLGMKLEDLTPQIQKELGISEKDGVLVIAVQPGSQADEAGLEAGDIIKEVNRKAVRTVREFEAAPMKGEKVLLLVKRGKETFYISVPTK
ncbi:Do family serine endopeptidase [Geomonas sp. RF6]|uniref:Do family serine endopeptidase n=1 Tax=Geomonas sp. RF6 TaxID=2897342 RepID=UPI001E3667A1|nr:Do family serine endopeptidase [Geomonas sp. RF6]UFS69512.1 Do family serine endopeptidase [Geomonas sp. RF6]